jgi:transposase
VHTHPSATPLSAPQVQGLIARTLRHNAAGQQLHRLDAVLLVTLGHSHAQVAAWFAVHPRTVRRWAQQAALQGAQGLAQHHGGGPHAAVNPQQLRAVQLLLQMPPADVGTGVRWTGKRLARELQRQLSLTLSERSCQRVLAAARHLGPRAKKR